jgi:hypothetical protein
MGPKKRPVAVDPFKIYMNAERFRIADQTLRSDLHRDLMTTLASPAMMLSAFASELYLKCLLLVETPSSLVDHSHDLETLFRKLSTPTRKAIERDWDVSMATDDRRRVRAAIKVITGEDVPVDLTWALSKGASAFVQLRYNHENERGGPKFLLGDFPQMLRRAVISMKPEWAAIIHSPGQPVPGFDTQAE